MRKTHIVILFVVLVAAIGGYFVFKNKKPTEVATSSEKKVEVVEKAPVLVTENASSTYAELLLSYPKSDSTHYPEVFAYVQNTKKEFWDEYGTISDEQAQINYMQRDEPYQLFISTKTVSSSKTTTFILETYHYTGGAHGGTEVSTFTYDKAGKLVKIDDVFSQNYLSVIAPLANKYFKDTLGDTSQAYMIDSGTEATTSNYSSWYLKDDAVVFIFGQYQVGPYVLGQQEFSIPKSQIQSILKANFK